MGRNRPAKNPYNEIDPPDDRTWCDVWDDPCGARTRAGTPCRCRALANGRCKYHGGLSTGPKTPEGLARSIDAMQAGRARWVERRRAARMHPPAPQGVGPAST